MMSNIVSNTPFCQSPETCKGLFLFQCCLWDNADGRNGFVFLPTQTCVAASNEWVETNYLILSTSLLTACISGYQNLNYKRSRQFSKENVNAGSFALQHGSNENNPFQLTPAVSLYNLQAQVEKIFPGCAASVCSFEDQILKSFINKNTFLTCQLQYAKKEDQNSYQTHFLLFKVFPMGVNANVQRLQM